MRKTVRKGFKGIMNALAGDAGAALREQIEAIGEDRFPNEACGFVIRPKRKDELVVIESPNRSKDPEHFFRIDNYMEVERKGEIVAVWHSHPLARPDASEADKTLAESCEHPIMIVSIPNRQWAYYVPTGYRVPLIGRPFVHGILDCYAAVRDYYRWPDMRMWAGADKEFKIELPDFDREDEWWKEPGRNLYLENVTTAGFVRVQDLKTNDAILVTRFSAVPNHAAVYIGDGMIFHHVAGRTSGLHPYVIDRGAYALHTYGIYRHKSLC